MLPIDPDTNKDSHGRYVRPRYEWERMEDLLTTLEGPDRDGKVSTSDSLARTCRKARLGWAEGEEPEILKKFRFLSFAIRSRMPKPRMLPSLAGGRGNFQGILADIPEQALARRRVTVNPARKGKGNLVNIVVNVDGCSAFDADYFVWRGAAMLALIEALEAAKMRVQVQICIASYPFGRYDLSHNQSQLQRYYVTVKSYGQPINPPILGYHLCSDDILRTLFFTFWNQFLPKHENDIFYKMTAGGVGYPDESDHKADIYSGPYGHEEINGIKDEASAMAWLHKTLTSYGVQLEHAA